MSISWANFKKNVDEQLKLKNISEDEDVWFIDILNADSFEVNFEIGIGICIH